MSEESDIQKVTKINPKKKYQFRFQEEVDDEFIQEFESMLDKAREEGKNVYLEPTVEVIPLDAEVSVEKVTKKKAEEEQEEQEEAPKKEEPQAPQQAAPAQPVQQYAYGWYPVQGQPPQQPQGAPQPQTPFYSAPQPNYGLAQPQQQPQPQNTGTGGYPVYPQYYQPQQAEGPIEQKKKSDE